MWIFTRQPRRPFIALILSIGLGSVLATLVYTGLALGGWLGAVNSFYELVLGASLMLYFAPLSGAVVGLMLVFPLLCLAMRLGVAGPVIALTLGLAPCAVLGWLDPVLGLYPLITAMLFIRLAYRRATTVVSE